MTIRRWSRASCLLAPAIAFMSVATARAQDDETVFGSTDAFHATFQGVIYKLDSGTGSLPTDYGALDQVARLYTDTIDVPHQASNLGFPGYPDLTSYYAVVYDGVFRISESTCYAFRLYSDDGSKLFIDGELVVDNDGTHPPTSRSGSTCLERGSHDIRVEYFQGPPTEIALQLFVAPDGGEETLFPSEDMSKPPSPTRIWPWLALLVLALAAGGAALRRQRNVNDPQVRVEWDRPDRHKHPPGSRYFFDDKPQDRVLLIPWDPAANVKVKVWVSGGWTRKNTGAGKLTLTAKNAFTGRNGIVARDVSVAADGTASATLSLGEMMKAAKITGPNLGALVLQASYTNLTVMPASGGVSGQTACQLFPMLRRLVVILPGAPGTEITTSAHPDTEAFASIWDSELLWLKCDTNGKPVKGGEASKLELFEQYTCLAPVYDLLKGIDALDEPEGYKVLRQGRTQKKRVPYFEVRAWPYDWRLKLEGHVARLVGSSTGTTGRGRPTTTAPWAIPSSLAAMLEDARKTDPHEVLSPQAIVVAHSTGGLILRKALGDSSFAQRVEHAFFANVPFFGAPKAYHVYITGDMGIPILDSDVLIKLVPNLPVFYYLAPSARYPEPVLEDHVNGKWVTYSRHALSAGQVVDRLVTAQRHYGRYAAKGAIDPWNKGLEASAKGFHAGLPSAAEVRKATNVTVFYSSGGTATVGRLGLKPRQGARRIAVIGTKGDGTVPAVSQKADWGRDELVELDGNPEHVAAITEDGLWEHVVERIISHPPKRRLP